MGACPADGPGGHGRPCQPGPPSADRGGAFLRAGPGDEPEIAARPAPQFLVGGQADDGVGVFQAADERRHFLRTSAGDRPVRSLGADHGRGFCIFGKLRETMPAAPARDHRNDDQPIGEQAANPHDAPSLARRDMGSSSCAPVPDPHVRKSGRTLVEGDSRGNPNLGGMTLE